MVGTLEGDQIKLRSVDRHTADSITFIFSGTASNDALTGNIFMGEYRTAKFTAKRHVFRNPKQRIMVPSGAPLAT
jgi:hypothetical protein